MMLANRDPNGPSSGRASRASNASGISRSTVKHAGEGGGSGRQDLLSSAGPGVMSMLRTSTEMGNVVGLTGDTSGFGNVPRAPQRRGASSRLSTASSLSNHSNHTSRQHRQWPSSSSAARHSMTREPMPPMPNVPQYVPDTLSPTMMNLPGSSPLVPMRGYNRDSQRSLSITHTMPHPEFRLSNNRSMGSLRNHEPVQRPKSPFAYPTRLRRPSYRPASPAWSEAPGSQPRRLQGQGGQGQAYPPGQMRLRIPSDTSLGYQDRAHRMPRHPSRGPSPSPAYYQMPHGDIPPVPPLSQYYHPAVDQARRLNRSVKGSVSSGSTNMRTDSDTPSSDLPLPPTPKDGASLNMLAGPPGVRMRRGTMPRMVREEVASGPLYYDYSEQFERDELAEPEAPMPMPTGYANSVKAVIHERKSIKSPIRMKDSPDVKKSTELKSSEVPGIAELPASPVVRRITRELIRKGLEPVSTTGDVVSSTSSPAAHGEAGDGCYSQDQITTHPVGDEMSASSMLPTAPKDNRHSILSQGESSLIDSSTIDFAVRCSIPAMTRTVDNGLAPEFDSVPASPGSPEKSTEDGMSELLAGYQHTDSKQEEDIVLDAEVRHKTESVGDKASERKSKHAQKSSDEQSFKSCTDVPEPVSPEPGKDEGTKSLRSIPDNYSDRKSPVKDSDARSFETCKDVSTPGRAKSMPASALPSSSVASIDLQARPASDMPPSTPVPKLLHKPQVPRRESSFSTVTSKLRGSSKPSMKQGSMSISGSSSTLSVTQQPPPVPPRESSASKEAQRINAVGAYLMRRLKGKKAFPKEELPIKEKTEMLASELSQQIQEPDKPVFLSEQPVDVLKTPEKALIKQDVENQKSTPPIEHYSPAEPLHVNRVMVQALHHPSFSGPSTTFPEPSSVYSSQDISLKTRAHSSPAGVPLSPKSPEHGRQDSQSTTHLSWAGRRPFGISSATASEPHLPLPSVQEDTTTDLRLSGYRYNIPQRYLPDLKEESHEDSSLNTSASNLKSSHFRFPYGSGPGMRTSVDDAIVFSRKSSTQSHRKSVVGGVHGLPTMEFSQANLLEKLSDALGGIRFSRSLGQLRLDLPVSDEGSPQRSVSVGEVRERTHDPVNGLSDVERIGLAAQPTGVIDFTKTKRAFSPEKLMAELDQVTIPSVTPLTQRFTKMLPSLSLGEYYRQNDLGEAGEFPEEEEIMENAIEEIHEVHPPSQKRSSARLRPVRGSSALMVMEDDVYEEITNRERGGGSPTCQGDGLSESTAGEAGTHAKAKDKTTTHTPTRQLSPVAELQAPSPVALRPRSHTVVDQAPRTSIESTLSSRRSLRSFVSTPTATDTRPWNFDKNYPWATTTIPSVDISLPPPVALRHSPRAGPSHLRNTLSDATTSTFTSTRTPTASPTGNASGSNANRQSHRLSIFGRSGDQAHAVGERYPTSALSPPTAIFRDHFSTCDTSDDEDFTTSRKTNKLTLRKRFSSAARNNTLTHSTPRVTRSKVNSAELASPASANENSSSTLQDRAGEARAFTSSNRHTFRDAEGMRNSAYHRQRIIESIKRWWYKSAELVRSISRRSGNRQDGVHSGSS